MKQEGVSDEDKFRRSRRLWSVGEGDRQGVCNSSTRCGVKRDVYISATEDTTITHLFEPLTLRGARFATASPSRRCASTAARTVSPTTGIWSIWAVGRRAARGWSSRRPPLSRRAAASVPQDLGIYQDGHIETLRRITAFLKEHGAVPGIQLAHAGRKASTRAPGRAGSRSPKSRAAGARSSGRARCAFDAGYQTPEMLDEAGIREIVRAFGMAAQRAEQAGFEVIELHGAHGYLLNSFLSPLSNQRTDGYGGSFQNRTRFLREVVAEVRRVWPERLPLFVRLSVTDWAEGGWSIDDSIEVGAHAEAARRGPDRLLFGRQCAPRLDSRRLRLPDRFRRADPARGRDSHRRGRDDHRARSRPTISCAPNRRIWSSWPANCCAIRTGRCAPPENCTRPFPFRRSTNAPGNREALLSASALHRVPLSGCGFRSSSFGLQVPRD